jgi:FMN phosphatase YigB (HAD superfamily)
VLSNSDDRLRPLLGLASYFPSLVISCEAGVVKPDPRVFRLAATALTVTPGQLFHVGDSHAMDMLGPERIGATGRQVVRGGTAFEPWQIRSTAGKYAAGRRAAVSPNVARTSANQLSRK